MKTSDLEFEVPPSLVADLPLPDRGASRLMLVKKDGKIEHLAYRDLPDILGGELCYLNNSKVRNRSLGRNQPIYASVEGGLGTPTAGLDITEELLQSLNHKFLTLHAGVETFRTIHADNVEEHDIHAAEFYVIPDPPAEPVVAIGTTVVKALETFGKTGKPEGESKLFIHPPFTFRRTKALLTNFHSPRDTHLALTWAFAGRGRMMDAYATAVVEKYRFGGFGDAVLFV